MSTTRLTLSRADVLNSFEISSGPWVILRPDDVPTVNASLVDKVISGNYSLRDALTGRGLTPAEDEHSKPCPFGAGPCPEDCRAISVWGLSQTATEEELLSMCRKFGAVKDVKLLKADGGGDVGCATITFEERSSAEEAQSVLHRTYLHDKEIQVGWGRAEDVWKMCGRPWLHVWIKKGTTPRQLFKAFRNAGAPCTDARVVREASGDEALGVGALAFRDSAELRAIRYALTDRTKPPGRKCMQC